MKLEAKKQTMINLVLHSQIKKIKNAKYLISACVVILTLMLVASCEQDDIIGKNNIMPDKFKVDVPSSLSDDDSTKSAYLKSGASGDTLQGNDIYANLKLFIHVGESAAEVVEDIILTIASNDLDEPSSLTFDGDDQRKKDVEIQESESYNGSTYDFGLTVKDKLLEEETGEGTAMKVYWNIDLTNGVDGIAILKPAYINLNDSSKLAHAMYRVTYNEVSGDYDARMTVEIAGIPTELQGSHGIDNLKMFVGKQGDHVDVYGNSNHPNATLFSNNTGYNWAFAASSSESENIAVAELGLPPSDVNISGRSEILVEHSIRSIFLAEIQQAFYPDRPIEVIQNLPAVQNYLKNTEAPGYFNANGFISAGNVPSDTYSGLDSRVKTLTPYNPKTVAELSIAFD